LFPLDPLRIRLGATPLKRIGPAWDGPDRREGEG